MRETLSSLLFDLRSPLLIGGRPTTPQELTQVTDAPFPSSDSSVGWTRNFACKSNDQVFVLDTVGFGDPNFKQDRILKELKNALNAVSNLVDCVVFVV